MEEECAWADPGVVSDVNFPCAEDGANCLVAGSPRVPNATHHPYGYAYGTQEQEQEEDARALEAARLKRQQRQQLHAQTSLLAPWA